MASEDHSANAMIYLPEKVTKTHRSTYVKTDFMHSEDTTLQHGTTTHYVDGNSVLAMTDQDDTKSFSSTLLQDVSDTRFSGGTTISFTKRMFTLSKVNTVADEKYFSNVFVVTYDADLGGNEPVSTTRHARTVEYALGGGTETTPQATTIRSYAGSSWNTTKGSAGTKTVKLFGSNVSVTNAYLEAQLIHPTATDINDIDMVIDTTPGPSAGTDTFISPILQSAVAFSDTNTGSLSKNIMTRADITSQFNNLTDTDFQTGIAVVAGISWSGPDRVATSMKLVVTYEQDYSTTAHSETKTVRFPLDSTGSGDTGSTQAACAVSTTCSFAYNAAIPDLAANADIQSVFFEIRGTSDTTSDSIDFVPQINGGTAGPTYDETEVTSDMRDMFIVWEPTVGSPNFVPNSAQQLDIVNGASVPINTLGGELVVTYKFSTGAATQAETVSYFMKQDPAELGVTKTAFSKSVTVSNTGLSVKNLYYKLRTAQSAAQTFTVYGTVGANTEKSNAYTLTGTNPRSGESVIIYDMTADKASFSSATTTMAGATQFSSATGDTEVGVELLVTFTWSGSLGGTVTKSLNYFGGTSQTISAVASTRHSFPINISLPEEVTKTHRSTYIETQQIHTNSSTAITLSTLTMTVNGSAASVAISEQDDNSPFTPTYFQDISSTDFSGGSTIPFTDRNYLIARTPTATNRIAYTNKFTVTYDAALKAAYTASVAGNTVQTGTATLTAGNASTTATITAVDTSKSFVVHSVSHDLDSPQCSLVSAELTNTTTVTFQRLSTCASTTSVTIKWYVASFTSGVTVQRGSEAIGSHEENITINSIETSKAFPIVSAYAGTTTLRVANFINARITSPTNLELSTNDDQDTVVKWQIVEFNDANVQTGRVDLTGTSATATISSVDLDKSWLLYSYELTSSGVNIARSMVRGFINDPTTLNFDRGAAVSAADITYYVVEFTNNTRVRSGSAGFPATDLQKNITIPAVDTTKSIVTSGSMYQMGGKTDYTTDDQTGAAMATLALTTSTNLQITRATAINGAATADIPYSVVDFSGTSAEAPDNSKLMRHGKWTNASGSEQKFTF